MMDIIDLAVALILVKLVDEFLTRKNQPCVIGEILLGFAMSVVVALGYRPLTLDGTFVTPPLNFNNETFQFMAELGIIILLFISGMEMNVQELKRSGKRGIAIASLGVAFPFLFVSTVAYWYFGNLQISLVIGAIFTATSVGVTVRTLVQLGKLHTDFGTGIVTAAIVDDVIAIMLLAVILGSHSPLYTVIGIGAFFLLVFLLSRGRMERFMDRMAHYLRSPHALLGFTFGIFLVFAAIAQRAEIAAITGAFFAGVLIGNTKEAHAVGDGVKTIGYALFIPLFFLSVGTRIDPRVLQNFNILFLTLIPLAFAGKFTGCALGARLGGMKGRAPLLVGIGMIPGMEVALVVASEAYKKMVSEGFVAEATQIITITVIHVLISSLAVPILLKMMIREEVKE